MKVTSNMLKKLVQEEAAKYLKEKSGELEAVEDTKKAEEVEACEYADTLENHVDFYKQNKVKEAKLLRQLKALREINSRIKRKITAKL